MCYVYVQDSLTWYRVLSGLHLFKYSIYGGVIDPLDNGMIRLHAYADSDYAMDYSRR